MAARQSANQHRTEVLMLLKQKTAVVYGAAGSVGAAVARAFAREGAAVFLAGRRLARVQEVADQIELAGGTAHAAGVDALDEAAVVAHADAIVERAGQLDISFNAIAVDHIQGVPLSRMTEAEVVGPVARRVATHLLTARAASRHMTAQGRGVIMTFTADAARLALPEVGSFGIACAAVEGLTRSLAAELGPYGIRVVCLRSMGSPDAPGTEGVWKLRADRTTSPREGYDAGNTERSIADLVDSRAQLTLLGRLPVLTEVGNVAAMMASDHASPLTATVVNVSCGEIAD
jgi:3-oxoacyl-[acyl-carrier protein] reductase